MPERLHVGRLDRAHGVRGEVIVSLVTNREERLAPGAVLDTDAGPLTVQASRRHKDRYIVQLEGVTDREAAERLRGLDLYGEPLDDPDELWVHDLIGAAVVDQDGIRRGTVEAVQANPASDLLVLDDGSLVPARFVVDVDPGVLVRVEVPAGLFDAGDGG